MRVLGIDTSNYTTSIAVADETGYRHGRTILEVKTGERGLRQSDALFLHTVNLPRLFSEIDIGKIDAVSYSEKPRDIEGSYMPCFLAGKSAATAAASAAGVPLFAFSHQAGHIMAALKSCEAGEEALGREFLAFHISGGTTELLLVEPDGKNVKAEKLGGTSDISAGQLIDRTGKLLGLPFPAGKSIDALSRGSDCRDRYRVKLHGLEFSFSGIQNKAEAFYAATNSPADTARFVMNCIVTCIADATRAALAEKPGLPVVFSGGVASNSMLRERMREFSPVFAEPQYSTDNAMGIAVLTALQEGL